MEINEENVTQIDWYVRTYVWHGRFLRKEVLLLNMIVLKNTCMSACVWHDRFLSKEVLLLNMY